MTRSAGEWDARYATVASAPGATVWTPGPNPLLADVLGGLPAVAPDGSALSCLDVAAGEGRHAVWLAGLGWQACAVDFSRVGLERAERAAAAAGVAVQTVSADVTGWEPSTQYDLVLCAYLHLPSAASHPLLRRLGSWVAPAGRLVLLGHDLDNLAHGVGGPQDPDVLWDSAWLRAAAVDSGLEVQRVEQLRRPVAGAGRAAVDVLLVAARPGPAAAGQDGGPTAGVT